MRSNWLHHSKHEKTFERTDSSLTQAKINEELIQTLPSKCDTTTFNNGSGKKPVHCKAHKNDFGLQPKLQVTVSMLQCIDNITADLKKAAPRGRWHKVDRRSQGLVPSGSRLPSQPASSLLNPTKRLLTHCSQPNAPGQTVELPRHSPAPTART